MESYFPALRKNENLRKRLAAEIIEGRFPHAYIIAGKEGSGKHTLAKNIAAALECHSSGTVPCGICDSCQKISGGFSPDVVYIRKDADKKEFTVNLIREIRDSLYISPNELEKRVYIIENAEAMNQNAQNAFLKMLEEPPAYVVFLLLCSNTENLLETIKSRAPILYTEHISKEEIKEHILSVSSAAKELNEISPEKLEEIVASADGSIGMALSLCEDSISVTKRRETVFGFLNALTSPSLSELDLFSSSLPSDSTELTDFLQDLKTALRDIAVFKFDNNAELLFFTNPLSVDEFAAKITVKKSVMLVEAANSLIEKIKFYLDTKLAAATFCSDARKIIMNEVFK